MANQAETTVLDELAQAVDRLPGNRGDFARSVGIGQVYLSQILNGKRPLARIPAGTLLRISQASGIPLDQLAAGVSSEAPSLAPATEPAE